MKIQLFIIVDEINQDDWVSLVNHVDEFSAYNCVHLLYFGSQQELLQRFSRLINKANFYLHVCMSSVESQINYLVRQDCDFYVTVSRPDYDALREWPGKIAAKTAALVQPEADTIYNNMLVSTPLHTYLCGFGIQDIITKTSIHCENHDMSELVFASKEEFFNESTTT